MEHRYAPAAVLRHSTSSQPILDIREAVGIASAGRVSGLAAPFEKWETIRDDTARADGNGKRLREKLAQGSFTEALAAAAEGRHDIVARMAHDPERVLGSVIAGTLFLRETAEGLEFDLDLPDTTDARDAMALIARGSLGVSVGFRKPQGDAMATGIDADGLTEWQVLKNVDLREISLTAIPAYKDTHVEIARTKRSPQMVWLTRVTGTA